MDEIQRTIDLLLPEQTHLDHFSVGVIDFSNGRVKSYGDQNTWFDLASVTKILGMGSVYALDPKSFSSEMQLLAEHRGSLPAWGLLPNPGWKDIIQSYPIKSSETLYSDFSAMRFTLEYQKLHGHSVPEKMKSIWDKEILFWKDLPAFSNCPKTGERAGSEIRGDVHDPNAWVIKEWCGHAGLFGTVGGVCQTLLNLEKKCGFIKTISEEMKTRQNRFIFGWDRVENPSNTLAGSGCSKLTFGHLGFTGTSVWIDAEKYRGHVILSNATRDGWYCKDGLNEMRRLIGQLVWR